MKKAELRKEYLRRRKELSENDVVVYSKKIHHWLFTSFPIHAYTTIHTFLPIKKFNEVDTLLIIDTLRQDFSTNIVIPKTHENGLLTNHLLKEDTLLIENKWGVSEVIMEEEQPIPNSTIDLILIPLLVFDKQGYRVGYGKGYYDRFLAECREDVIKIGVCFFEPIERIEDTDAFDIRLNYCITPNKIWSF